MPITQDSKLNLAKVDEKMYRKVNDNVFFRPFISLQRDIGEDDNGQRKYAPGGGIVEKSMAPIKFKDGVDHGILTMQNDLVGDALYGDTVTEGTGEEWAHNHMRVHVNATKKVVKVQSGDMDGLRGQRFNIREEARPQLERWFIKEKNAHFYQAIYEGASKNLTEGTNIAKNGIGLSARLPSNAYYLGSSGTWTTMGTASKNKSKANMDTGSAAAKVAIDTKSIDAASLLCQELNISQALTWNGNKMWMWVIAPYQLYNLRQDTAWLAAEKAFTTSKRESKSAIINGAVNAYCGFIFYVDIKAVRPWNSDIQSFEGANGWKERGTYAVAAAHEINDCTYILGNGALAVSEPRKYRIKEQSYDFDSDVEVQGNIIDGTERVDFVASADEAVYFAKGNADFTVYETAKTVINNQVLVMMIDRA